MSERIASSPQKVNWKQAGWLIGLTLGLSWILNLVRVLRFGDPSEHMTAFLQLQMFIPSFVAIDLQRFSFADSPVHRNHYRRRPNWFFKFYLLLICLGAPIDCHLADRPDLACRILEYSCD